MSASFAPEHSARFLCPPYRDFHPSFCGALQGHVGWPEPEQYDELARQVPRAADVQLPRFVTENREAVRHQGGYEQHVAKLRAVPTRAGHWHDFFNMAVWAHFPKLRWALNSLHVDADPGQRDPRNGRTPAQNVAATFDEAGMLVISTNRGILEDLRALHFKRAFWERRQELLQSTRFWVVGHGLLESLLWPHSRLAARSLQLQVASLPSLAATQGESDSFRFEIDDLAAARVRAWHHRRTVLDPVPVLAIPGYSENGAGEFYEDMQNIRFDPVSRRPPDLAAD
ncbi:MAG TPA: DUF3025 domain-containing protein [Polyangiaceae bacterium]|nr:DUF3025 domain-containing protein [Polyangiaceae bacterium]